MPKPVCRCAVLLLCLAITAVRIAARADDLDNIIFSGTVRDSQGAVIAQAKVLARHVATGVGRTLSTDDEGRYRIVVSNTGAYVLTVAAPGFKDETSKELEVTSGRTVALDFVLTPAGVDEQVVVEAGAAPLIDTTRTVVGDTIRRTEIEGLPILTRNPLELVFLLGGSTEAPLATSSLADEGRGSFLRGTPEEAGVFSLTGAPATSNNITIDGLDNNDDRTARERIALSPESVAEVQVITNQYAAEYGRASGGRINIFTRGGTSNYRGEAYAFFGDESLNANTFFRNARGLDRVPQQERREGALVSGPIVKARHFFTAGYERLDVTDFIEISTLLPFETNPRFQLPKPNQPPSGSSVGVFREEISTPENRNLVNARSDFNLNESHNATVRFDLSRGANRRGFPGGSRLAESILIEGRDSYSVSVADNLVVSNHFVNQGRFQFSRLVPRNKPGELSIGVVIEEPSRIVAGAFTGSASSPAFAREEQRTQFQDTLSLAVGQHQLKVGGDVQLVRSTFADLFATGGQFRFDSVGDFLANSPKRFVQRFNTESRLENNVVGLFIQDEWKLAPNVTVSLGMRWDNESIIDDRDNVSPRLAVSWDPFGRRSGSSGRTVVRAGFGMFYNRALLRTIDDFSLGRSTIIVDSEIDGRVLTAVRFPEPITSQSLVDRFGVKETAFLRRLSPDLEIPHTVQTGLGVERQISKSLVATADYIFTRGAHLWRESNVNAPVLPAGFNDFTDYLLSRDFDNRVGPSGVRPISGANADVVRFDLGANTASTPGAIVVKNGLRIITLGLNTQRSANISAALNAINFLRPDPALTQVERLESTGNSFYHGGIFTLRGRFGSNMHFRAVYTLSKLIDEGTTNTASPQDVMDRRAERARSLQDQRHRFTLTGAFQVPRIRVELAPIISLGSSRPFNIGAGFDRNLNDIENDRPNSIGPIGRPVWRRPGSPPANDVKTSLVLAPVGSSGNLPRNFGRGPGTRTINLRASRSWVFGEHVRLRGAVDVFNVFNNSVFSFGSEFIDRDDADFLVPRRTQRPRIVQVSVKMFF
ncbi:MAG TPA: TonB-dependent receptor [Blastocatellia bacterium]|nr:TonB-dependent receptor [Blastocatellia bacterium]